MSSEARPVLGSIAILEYEYEYEYKYDGLDDDAAEVLTREVLRAPDVATRDRVDDRADASLRLDVSVVGRRHGAGRGIEPGHVAVVPMPPNQPVFNEPPPRMYIQFGRLRRRIGPRRC